MDWKIKIFAATAILLVSAEIKNETDFRSYAEFGLPFKKKNFEKSVVFLLCCPLIEKANNYNGLWLWFYYLIIYWDVF